jgi:hypothetical protein
MTEVRLAAHYGREAVVDHCASCGGLWFDGLESQQLTAGGTLELLELMADMATPRALGAQPRCLRCRRVLREVTDTQRGTRFTYHRCPEGHGRFITAYQFLREKHLVRELSTQELLQLRASIQQVNCVNCGAPVRLAGGSACIHCRTPVSTVDPAQLRVELQALQERDERSRTVDPTLPVRLAHERAKAERDWAAEGQDLSWMQDAMRIDANGGLLATALRMLTRRVR